VNIVAQLKAVKVLIVEDEPDIMDLVKDILNSETQPQPRLFDYDFLEARDGEKALQIARDSQPGLILLDVKIPKLNGYEVCRQLKSAQKTSRIPVLMITAKSQKREMVEGFKAGANDYLVKPFEPSSLREKVQHFLQQAQPS
jgi:DNA-binding response OmpR family regulator